VRLAFRGRYEGLLGLRGGGSTWSFAARSHDAGRAPDLALDGGRLIAVLGPGSFGLFVPLGEVAPEDLRPDGGTPAGRARARIGETVLLRSVRPGEHDVLVALRPLGGDERGLTLAWRVLRAR
jgi:hypothetical protein